MDYLKHSTRLKNEKQGVKNYNNYFKLNLSITVFKEKESFIKSIMCQK